MNFSEKYIASIMDEDSDLDSHGSAIFLEGWIRIRIKIKIHELRSSK
jgi:hypothetical protein